jgi:DEAD/DEAH box helicase domain-containing protein
LHALRHAKGYEVVAEVDQPSASASHVAWPVSIDPRVREVYRRRGVVDLYSHQYRAISAIESGRDVVLATATASGKSLCFQAPLLNAVMHDPASRALLLYPTKALARDQVEGMRALVREGESTGLAFGLGIYDGDASPDQRRAARRQAHAVATNPDMLHRSLLPNHQDWGDFLAALRFVVIDEVHTYRGLFGSHVGQVLRRLWRLCAHYGSRPQIVACSATIANPGEHVRRLCARDFFEEILESGAPHGPRKYVIVNPKVVDPVVGVRRDFIKVTREVAAEVRKHSLSALLFCRTRKAVELMTRYLREDEVSRQGVGAGPKQDPERAGLARDLANHRIRGYRGGYLPELRREVEGALRDGEAKLVASTNALELGMDIGQLDVVILAGYPGSRAALFQRAGRAGRRGQSALTIMVLSSAPSDQFLAGDPNFVFDRQVEHARIDPDNPEVLIPHLRCAAFELPFRSDEDYPGLSGEETVASLRYLENCSVLNFEPDAVHESASSNGVWRFLGSDLPAHQVEIRGTLEQNFSVVLVDGPRRGEVIAEVDFEDAPVYLHPGAIYAIEGQTHEVVSLQWQERKAYVRPASSDYYTEAISVMRVRILDAGDAPLPACGSGYLHVSRSYPAFKKIRLRTHETVGQGPIVLPDWEIHTQVAYWSSPRPWLERVSSPRLRAKIALAAGHAILHAASLVCMCDVSDLGSAIASGEIGGWAPVLGSASAAELSAMAIPVIYLYDRQSGGAGLALHVASQGAAFMERAASLVAGCRCSSGCPVCLGADVLEMAKAERVESATTIAPHLAQNAGNENEGESSPIREHVVLFLRMLARDLRESNACASNS